MTVRYMGTPQAAKYLSRAQVTLRKWRCGGTGPAFRIVNGRAMYEVADLDAWLEQHGLHRSTSEYEPNNRPSRTAEPRVMGADEMRQLAAIGAGFVRAIEPAIDSRAYGVTITRELIDAAYAIKAK